MAYEEPKINRVCLDCGGNFLSKRRPKKRCDECWKANLKKTAKVRYYRKHEPVKMKTLKCPHCKQNFDTKRWDKIYCCPKHKTLAERRRLREATPEDRRRQEGGWTVKDRKIYGSRYYREVIKPREKRQRQAEDKAFAIIKDKIPPPKIQGLTADEIVRYWGRIIQVGVSTRKRIGTFWNFRCLI